MGEVYRAVDSKLGREVAIKVLPEEFVADPERLARFEREARVLAALEHPNIAGIYGLEEVEGKQLLVMQLAPGEDLSIRLQRGALPTDETLGIALQITQALEAAHDRGIVHRDLKPANLMLGPDGSIKVLDFGLAKAWDEGPASDPSLTASPTLTAQMTQAGVILGTAGYMSPEQARGQEADHRSDIWSFGVVLHEMLTGQRMFQADTVSDTLARVLMAEPDWEEIDATLPAPLANLLRRCLERDVARRLQAIGEARITIEDHLENPHAAQLPPPTDAPEAKTGPPRWLMVTGGLLAGAVAGWLLASGLSNRIETPNPDPVRFAVHTPDDNAFVTEDVHAIAISPDGQSVTFVAEFPDASNSGLYLKRSDESEPRIVPSTEGARNPFFSPDGNWVGYFTDSELRKVNLEGGSSMPIHATGDRRGAAWHTNGKIYFVPHSDGPILEISENGGQPSPVTTLDESRRERTHRWPTLLPDGRGLIYTSDTFESTEYYDDARIEWIDPETGDNKVLLEGASRAVYSPTGHLVFARDGALYAVEFDLKKLETRGTPRLVVPNVSTIVASGAVQFSLSDEGSLAYIPGGKTAEMWGIRWVEGNNRETDPVALEVGQYVQLSLSPAGDLVALVDASRESTDIWIYDIERGSKSRLTFDEGAFDAVWTPDGKTIVYRSDRTTDPGIYAKPADGRGDPQVILRTDNIAWPVDVTPDGRYLLATVDSGEERQADGFPLWLIDLHGNEEPRMLMEELVAGNYATISPDGNWIAYSSRTSGRSQIYVRPFPAGAGKWQVSDEPSREPRWSKDGRRLFYRTAQGFRYVDVDLADSFAAGPPHAFSTGNMMSPFSHTYSVSDDGQRLLVLLPSDSELDAPVHVVLNWRTELEELMGSGE